MSAQSDDFKFHLSERVSHPQDPACTFMVVRRWLDVDAPPGQERFYLLRPNISMHPNDTVGPVPEHVLSQSVD